MSFSGQNSYILYVRYQKLFTTWLVNAAAELGETIGPQRGHFIIPFDRLVGFARAISDRGSVPQSALYHVNYMLKLRGNWDPYNDKRYKIKGGPRSFPRFFLHTHAMNTLREVRRLLGHARTSPDALYGFGNEHATYSLPTLPGEAFFAWVCFFNDLLVIREYVKMYWNSYALSFESLTTRALVTNMAIRAIRSNCIAQMNITANLPDKPPNSLIIEWVYQGITGDFLFPSKLERGWNDFEASWCCFEAETHMRTWLKSMRQNHNINQPVPNHQYFLGGLVQYFSAGWTRSSTVKHFVHTVCAFLHNLRCLSNLPGLKCSAFLPCIDEITSIWLGWKEGYLSEFNIPIWLTVAMQIWVDIRTITRSCLPSPIDDLKRAAEIQASLVRKYIGGNTVLRRIRTDNENMPAFGAILKANENYVKKDMFTNLLPALYRPGDSDAPHTQTPFFFHEIHPLLCGMQSWWFELEYRLFESWAVQLHESITPAAFLYMEMYSKGLVSQWLDMEFVIQTRGTEFLPYGWERGTNIPPGRFFRSAFNRIYCPKANRQNAAVHRYLDGLIWLYFQPSNYGKPPSLPHLWSGSITTTILDVTERTYPPGSWREGIEEELRPQKLPNVPVLNILRWLDIVTVARHADEELSCFDWFKMDEICEMFFKAVRLEFSNSFNVFRSENPGADLNHTPKCSSDGPNSLDALYYLLFPEDSDTRDENMILAALCLDSSIINWRVRAEKQYTLEGWSTGIKRYLRELDISLDSVAPVLQSLITGKGSAVRADAARRQREFRKVRIKVPTDKTDLHVKMSGEKWYHYSHFRPAPIGSGRIIRQQPSKTNGSQVDRVRTNGTV